MELDGMYRGKCPDGDRCLHGCHTSERCFHAYAKDAMTREQVSLALEAALKQIRFQAMLKPRVQTRSQQRRANWLRG